MHWKVLIKKGITLGYIEDSHAKTHMKNIFHTYYCANIVDGQYIPRHCSYKDFTPSMSDLAEFVSNMSLDLLNRFVNFNAYISTPKSQ